MNGELAKAVGTTSKSARIWGVVTLVMGMLAIAAPFVAGVAAAMMVGFLLVLAGGAQTIYAFQAGSFGRGLMVFLFGGITIVAGAATLLSPVAGLATLTMILIAYFIVDGAFALIAGFQLKPAQGWGWMVVSGLVTVLLALLIWQQWPFSGAWAVGTLVGVRLIFSGMSMMAIGAAGKDISRTLQGR
jgi:uncharacterized membrane protein HdeD (DUF308 family)